MKFKIFNWVIVWVVLGIEFVLIYLLTHHRAGGWNNPQDMLILMVWALLPFVAIAGISWKYGRKKGPLPGPVIAYGLGGLVSLFASFAFYGHAIAGILLLGLIVQTLAGIFNFVGLKGEI